MPDPTAGASWEPVDAPKTVTSPDVQWAPVATPSTHPDLGAAQWSPVHGPVAKDAQWKPVRGAAGVAWTPSHPGGGRQTRWLTNVGPNDIMGDYNQPWQKFGAGGIRPQFKTIVDSLGNAGFSMGIYDFDRGHHYAPNDPHLDGRAMDVDSVNGESVGTQASKNIVSFITTAIGRDPHIRVGVPKEIYAQMPPALQSRAFVDAPAHIHVELTPEGLTNAHATPSPVDHMPVADMTRTSYAGLQLPNAKRDIELWAHKAAQLQAAQRARIQQITRVPTKEFLAVLGAPQRGVGEAIGGAMAGHNLQQLVHDVWHGITDLDTSQHATDSVRALLGKAGGAAFGVVSRQQVNEWVNETDIPQQLKPYLSNLINTTEDMTAQTLSDPLTYAGGLGIWAKAVSGGVRGLGAAGRTLAGVDEMIRTAAAAGHNIGPLGALLRQAAQHYATVSTATRAVAGRVGQKLANVSEIRPDLSDFSKGHPVRGQQVAQGGFTHVGKQRRMAVENSELKVHSDGVAADQQAARGAQPARDLSKQYLTMMHKYGSQADSNAAAKVLGIAPRQATGWLAGHKGLADVPSTLRDIQSIGASNVAYTADEALAALKAGRSRVRQYRTAMRTQQMAQQFPDALKPGSTPKSVDDWMGVAMDPKRSARDEEGEGVLNGLRELQRANVMVFPYPHGIVNVGQLTYLGAPEREGLRTVLDGFRYMLGAATKGKLPGSLVADEATLSKYGAAATYVHEHEAPGLWAHWPAALGGEHMKSYIIHMQGQLAHMESSWRASLWDALERSPDTRKLDPLIRGAMVAQHVGDPRNVAAFVRAFEQLGGPFVAYRLGIVPRAVLEAIIKNPQRILAAIRPVDDMQHNRTHQAQQDNTLMVNDPVNNAARMMGPGFLSYMTSPSTIGLIGIMVQANARLLQGEPWEEAYLNAFNELNPLGGLTEMAGGMMPTKPDSGFNPMPGQKMSLTDHLMTSAMMPFVSHYFAKAANPKYQAQQERRTRKNAEKFDQDFLDLLTGGR